jgi:hypothetical protein
VFVGNDKRGLAQRTNSDFECESHVP